MYGKIENGRLVVAGQKIKIENGYITNPTEEQLRELGYLLVVYTEKPIYNKEEEKLVEKYEVGKVEDDSVIFVEYEVVALTDEEHNAVIQQEIEAEESKITARNVREAILNDNYAKQKLTEIESNIYELRQKLSKVEQVEE